MLLDLFGVYANAIIISYSSFSYDKGEDRNGIATIYKKIGAKYLQQYLNEFCRTFNRRFFCDFTNSKYDLFDRLVIFSALYTSNLKCLDYASEMERVGQFETLGTYHHVE